MTAKALPRLRRTARVMLLEERSGDVLLIRFVAVRDSGEEFVFWVAPGGEVEPRETDAAAAARELHEELGLNADFREPVHTEQGGEYVHLGERVRSFDVFFAARCVREAPVLAGVTPAEIGLMREARWWTPDELRRTAENIFPRQIAELAAEVLRTSPGRVPTATR